MPVIKTCRNCGVEFKVPPSRVKTAYTCSKACKYALAPKTRSVESTCRQCGTKFQLPVSRKKRGNGVFCSNACRAAHQRTEESREASRKRIEGDKNPMWRGGLVSHSDGYVYQHASSHPFASNGYVFQHRLVVEERMRQEAPDHPFLIDGFLSARIHVHHRDNDKTNNSPDNLMAMTSEAHLKWHKAGTLPDPWECWPNVHPGA